MKAWRESDDAVMRLMAILDGVDEGVLVIDDQLVVRATNARFTELTGFPRSAVVGASPPYPWWPSDGRDERGLRLRAEVDSDELRHEHVVVFQRSDGSLMQADGRLRHVDIEERLWVMSYRETTEQRAEALRTAAMLDSMSDAVVRLSADGTVTFVSDGAAAYAHLPPHQVVGNDMAHFVHPDDRATIGSAFTQALQGTTSTATYRFIGSDGVQHWFEGVSAPIHDLAGAVTEVQVLSRDITERVLTDAMEAAVLAVISAEAAHGARRPVERVVAEQAASLGAVERAAVVRLTDAGAMASAHCPAGRDSSWCLPAGERTLASCLEEHDHRDDVGQVIAVPIPVARGASTALVVAGTHLQPRCRGMVHDFASRIGIALDAADSHERLRELAETDGLTGVLNRRAFEASLDTAIPSVRRGSPSALAFIDLDGLKAINDEHGHAAGDQALIHIAECIRETARADDVVGRLGGDEFAWLLRDATARSAQAAADRLGEVIADPHRGVPGVSASIGITPIRPDDHAADVMQRADELLYRAKAAGRGRVEVSA